MKRAAGAFALGLITVAAFAPFYLFPLAIGTLAALLLLAERRPGAGEGFRLGFAFGLGYFLGGVSWVYVSLHDFGAMPAPVALTVTVLFCAYLALFPASALALTGHVRSHACRRLLAFPAAWILAEWARGWLFSGFPWLAIGYSQAPDSPLSAFAPLAGVYGTGLVTVVSAGFFRHALAEGWRRPAWRPCAMLLILWAGAGALKSIEWTRAEGDAVSISLLQGNVPQNMKWRPEQVMATLQLYGSMIRATRARLIVLPETALPLFLQEVPAAFLERITEHAHRNGSDVLIGLPERGRGHGYFNSVVSFGTSPTQTYRKSHLVPFGEFIPLRLVLAPLVETLAIPLTDFSRGDPAQRPLALAGQRVAINICYEDAFGEEIIRQLPEATLLVNVSNVAWFGESIAPMQHLQISQMRALETGRPMLRATNTGMTAVIDPRGRVVAAAATFARETVEARVRGHAGATPYVRFGNAPAVVLSVLMLAIALSRVCIRRSS